MTHPDSNRIVLLGSIGFVGANILRHFRGALVSPSLEEADLTDRDSLLRTLQPGDCIINAAGYANATDTTERGKALFQAINIDGLRNLAEAACARQAAQLIHLSSIAAMGRWYGTEGITEEMIRPDTTPYAASKRAGELLLHDYADRLPTTILRPTSVFGEGRGLAHTLCKLADRRVIPLPGNGLAKIPFTYIGNITHAIELSVMNPRCFNRTFIIGDAAAYPLRDIILAFAHALDRSPTLVPVPLALATLGTCVLEALAARKKTAPLLNRWRLGTLTNTLSYSIAAFQDATGYQPPYSLDDAARRIAAWYRETP